MEVLFHYSPFLVSPFLPSCPPLSPLSTPFLPLMTCLGMVTATGHGVFHVASCFGPAPLLFTLSPITCVVVTPGHVLMSYAHLHHHHSF